MVTLADFIEYVETLATDNPSLLDSPIHDFVYRDDDDNEFVVTLEKL